MTPIETAIAKVPLPGLFGAFEQQLIQDYALAVCQQVLIEICFAPLPARQEADK